MYDIPTGKNAKTDVAWALQRLIYSLQISKTAVSTKELTNSFGWDSRQLHFPQDALEILRQLLDLLENRIKGTLAEKDLQNMFVVEFTTYIFCININHESRRTENFWDLQSNVAKNKSLDDSFKEFIEVTTLDGDQQYFTGEHGLQDAKRGLIFKSFPPVLYICLKRYHRQHARKFKVSLCNCLILSRISMYCTCSRLARI